MTPEAGPFSGPPPYDLRGCDLSRMNLGSKDLTNAKLQNAKLLGTVFNGVLSLAGADLSGAVMGNGTDFTGCDLSKANFGSNPRLGGSPYALTKFVGATVPQPVLGLNWAYLDLTDAIVVDLPNKLNDLKVTYSNLAGFNFAGRMLSNARFEGVALPGANFAKATLTGARFDPALSMRCDLTGANFTGITMASGSLADCILSRADFTRADFSEATAGKPSFAHSAIDGARFDGTNLVGCDLTDATRSTSATNLTSFRGAKLKLMSIGTAWSYLDLTDATLVGLADAIKEGASLSLRAQYSVLSGLDLSNAKLSKSDLTGTTLAGTKFTGAMLDGAQMCGAHSTYEAFRVSGRSEYDEFLSALQQRTVPTVTKVFAVRGYTVAPSGTTIRADGDRGWTVTDPSTKHSYGISAVTVDGANSLVVTDPNRVARFDNATLTDAKLGPDKGARTVLRGAMFTNAALGGADLSNADLGPVDPHDLSTGTNFVGAKMNGVGLSQAALAGANLAQAFLHGANLAGANLKGADLSGAQLGSLAPQFTVPETSDHYQSLLAALDRADGAEVVKVFEAFRHPLDGAIAAEIKAHVPQRSWRLSHRASKSSYTVLHWTSSRGYKSLIVSVDTKAATLTGAYMPNARLTDANLNGVAASGLQLYGDVHLEGAILDESILSNANLAGSHLGVKALHRVNLSYANLINSKFRGVDLTHGVVLSYASLQGTDFTDCHLDGVNLEYAAVSVKLSGTTSGTYLFEIADAGVVKEIVGELTAVADPMFPVELAPGPDRTPVEQLVDYLKQGNIMDAGPILVKRGLTLPAGAKIQATTETNAWQVIDSKGAGFNVWLGYTRAGVKAVFARPGTPRLRDIFKTHSGNAGTLRWQSTISARFGANHWEIDNDSANPENFQLGYVKILAIRADDGLVFYGTMLRIERLADDNTRQIVPVTLVPTVLGPTDAAGEQQCGPNGAGSYFGPATVCPNTVTLSVNQSSKTPVRWEEMLRAPESPAPPTCVPSPNQYCPQVSASAYASDMPDA
ncbi:pentapeptide repeat-containing protein [Mycobacterium sp. 155]|uniref:pentapeptide repeat-containing protein n=1 Tax=Mycobacterium sp. 155 TaxID=1157943 RepID=UPI0003A6F9FB|nr:pentapeptide repeat-containing protein [Mycobacterium sp. 155]